MKVGILGAGAWGTALAIIAQKAGNLVVLWSHTGKTEDFDEPLAGIEITREFAALANCECWLIATPAAFFRETLAKSLLFYKKQPVIICTKGLEPDTGKFMSEVLAEELPDCAKNQLFGVLSGPQFAAEVARGVPTGSSLAGSEIVQKAGKMALAEMYLSGTSDIIGTEICGVGKNAVAIIAGFYSIKAAGENEKALKFTLAWNEVVQLGLSMDARLETFLGFCGIGDLFLSATSATSRNFSAGIALARGESLSGTVEGVSAIRGLLARAGRTGLEMPVLEAMAAIIV